MIANNVALGRTKAAEENLYSLIKMKKKHKYQSILVYDDYATLFQLFLTHSPEKVLSPPRRPSFSARPCSLTRRSS